MFSHVDLLQCGLSCLMANISADFFLAFASALQRLEDLLELASESFHLMRNAHWCCGKSPVHLVIVQKKHKETQPNPTGSPFSPRGFPPRSGRSMTRHTAMSRPARRKRVRHRGRPSWGTLSDKQDDKQYKQYQHSNSFSLKELFIRTYGELW